MKRPDPTRFTGESQGKRKPDELEMRGFSAPTRGETETGDAEKTSPTSSAPASKLQTRGLTESQGHRLTDRQSHRVTEPVTDRLTDFADYDVPNYRRLKRVELRLTHEQNRFLDVLEENIARERPEGSRSDPDYRRITKNSIVRALVETACRLQLRPDARGLKNERDLVKSVVEELCRRLVELQSNRSTESVSDRETERVTE